jgi:hypothetical protein
MAIFNRIESCDFDSLSIEFQPFSDGPVAAVSGSEVTGDPADGGDAHARLPVDFPIGQAAFQQFDYGPTVSHGLQFCRRAQIAEKTSAFLDASQRENRAAQGAFVLLLLPLGDGAIGFHELP